MRGGRFDYREYALIDIADEIDKENIKYGKDIADLLREVYKLVHSLDYWLSGDIGEKEFEEKLKYIARDMIYSIGGIAHKLKGE